MFKVVFALVAAMLIATVAARSAFDATVSAQRQPTQQPWAQNQMEFIAWNDEKWRAWIRDDSFEQLPQNTHRWTRHANPSLAYIDWHGQSWQAKIDGGTFLLAHRGNWNGPIVRAEAIRYRDWEGRNTLRTVDQLSR